ncbi:MAG: ABC transporter permease, partial [Desulfatitalea sp.]|nr:ABC transporter permease [Desulfatitalea sp.]NNJ99796.1 ABC transporter permease [Desulfatitalea sp.]
MHFLLQGLLQAFDLLLSGDAATYSAVAATVTVSGYAMAASLLIGLPAGFALGYYHFPGRRHVRTLVDTLLALPTVFIGLM